MSKVWELYKEIGDKVLGRNTVQEFIGDNSVDNLVADVARTTDVEVAMFVCALLNTLVDNFSYAYERPQFAEFGQAMEQLVKRYRFMDGTEQADLITKVHAMFKGIFVTKYASLGAQTAETIAEKYAHQMVNYLKSSNVQSADLATDTIVTKII